MVWCGGGWGREGGFRRDNWEGNREGEEAGGGSQDYEWKDTHRFGNIILLCFWIKMTMKRMVLERYARYRIVGTLRFELPAPLLVSTHSWCKTLFYLWKCQREDSIAVTCRVVVSLSSFSRLLSILW